MNGFGVVVDDEEIMAFLRRIDLDGDAKLTLPEFAFGVNP
jgi:hypothetical protein